MARCSCSGTGCNCLIVAGDGAIVTGSGTPSNPFVVSLAYTSFDEVLQVNDTPSLNLTLTGSGTTGDPLVLSGTSTPALRDLRDVDDPSGPLNGESPVWVGGGNGHWEFRLPPANPPGAVNVDQGLSGTGAVDSPLSVEVSGEWGVAPLDEYGGDDTVGLAVYVDSNGQLRAQPVETETPTWNSILGKPATFPPSSHSHSWGQITGKPTTFPPQIGSTSTTAAAGNHSHSWGQITGKPSSFNPSSHTHGRGDITGIWSNLGHVDENGSTSAVVGITSSGLLYRAYTSAHNDGRRSVVVRAASGRFNAADPVSDVNVATKRYVDQVANNVRGDKANAHRNIQTTRYSDGTAQAHSREAGSNRYSVWVDGGYTFGRATSSIRYKEDVQPWDVDPAKVLALADHVVSFHRKVDPQDVRDYGLIAETMHEYVPELVQWWTDPEVEDGEPQIDGIKYELLGVALLPVVKRLSEQIEDLRAQVARLTDGEN